MRNCDGIYAIEYRRVCQIHDTSLAHLVPALTALYRSKFGAKDRSAGVNNLYVYDSDCPFFTWILMSHFPRYAFSGRRVKWNRGICTCHSQSVGRATTMAVERSGYRIKRLFYIRVCAESFSLNPNLYSMVILPLSFFSIIITYFDDVKRHFFYTSIIVNLIYRSSITRYQMKMYLRFNSHLTFAIYLYLILSFLSPSDALIR